MKARKEQCMNTDFIQSLTETFEAHAQQTDNGVEYWLARDLQHLLGYSEWRNFTAVNAKAKTACQVAGHPQTIILLKSTK
jgi:DNA-damage-inducible protein D